MAYTKNPHRYPDSFFAALEGNTQTLTFTSPRDAKTIRHKFSNFRRALREANGHPVFATLHPDWFSLYRKSLLVKTSLSSDGLTLTLIAPRTLDSLVSQPTAPQLTQTQTQTEAQEVPAAPEQVDFTQARLDEITADFKRTINSHFFPKTYKQLPDDLPATPPEILDLAYSIAPNYRPNNALEELLNLWNELNAPRD